MSTGIQNFFGIPVGDDPGCAFHAGAGSPSGLTQGRLGLGRKNQIAKRQAAQAAGRWPARRAAVGSIFGRLVRVVLRNPRISAGLRMGVPEKCAKRGLAGSLARAEEAPLWGNWRGPDVSIPLRIFAPYIPRPLGGSPWVNP